MDQQKALINQLIWLLEGGGAPAGFADALNDLPKALRGKKVEKLPYSILQLVEHIRITQWDMVKFSKDEKHISPQWPEGYWPKEAEPGDDEAWEKTNQQNKEDRVE